MIGLKERDPTQPNLTNLTGLLLNNIVCAIVSECVVCVCQYKQMGGCLLKYMGECDYSCLTVGVDESMFVWVGVSGCAC